jgi:hypothetical protein
MTCTRKYLWIVLIMAALLPSTVRAKTLGAGEPEMEFIFRSIDVPGALRTIAQGINDAGDISGFFVDTQATHGFLLRRGRVTVIDYPGAAWTQALGINAQGDIVGTYGRPGDPDPSFTATPVLHGFLRTRHRQFRDVLYPGHLHEIPQRITSTGIILGCYHDMDLMDSMFGFSWSRNGLAPISVPASMHNGATPDGSRIAGRYTDLATGQSHGYLLDRGTFIPFDVPGSATTNAWDINPQGDIVGDYQDADGLHGFLRTEDGDFFRLDFPGSNNTQARGINAQRKVVGFYVDSGGARHGFVARPRDKKGIGLAKEA